MSQEIKKRHSSYTRHDGFISGWERRSDGKGHVAVIEDKEGDSTTFRWRDAEEPKAGATISVIMPRTGVTVKHERPLLILGHDSGTVFREQNAPDPRGTKDIMFWLITWILGAMFVSGIIIYNSEGLTMQVLLLLAAAFIVWRLAIATSELRMDERAQQRLRDEETLCLEIVTSEWRLANMERLERHLPQATIAE